MTLLRSCCCLSIFSLPCSIYIHVSSSFTLPLKYSLNFLFQILENNTRLISDLKESLSAPVQIFQLNDECDVELTESAAIEPELDFSHQTAANDSLEPDYGKETGKTMDDGF